MAGGMMIGAFSYRLSRKSKARQQGLPAGAMAALQGGQANKFNFVQFEAAYPLLASQRFSAALYQVYGCM